MEQKVKKSQRLKVSLKESIPRLLNKEIKFTDLSDKEQKFLSPIVSPDNSFFDQDIELLYLFISIKDLPLPKIKQIVLLCEKNKVYEEQYNIDLRQILKNFFKYVHYISPNKDFWIHFIALVYSYNPFKLESYLKNFSIFFKIEYSCFIDAIADNGFSGFVLNVIEPHNSKTLIQLLDLLNSLISITYDDQLKFIKWFLYANVIQCLSIFNRTKLSNLEIEIIDEILLNFAIDRDGRLFSMLNAIGNLEEDQRNLYLNHIVFILETHKCTATVYNEIVGSLIGTNVLFMQFRELTPKKIGFLNNLVYYFLELSEKYPSIFTKAKSIYLIFFLYLNNTEKAINKIENIENWIDSKTDFEIFPRNLVEYLFFEPKPPHILTKSIDSWSKLELDFISWIISDKEVRNFPDLPYLLTKKQVSLLFTFYDEISAPEFDTEVLQNVILTIRMLSITSDQLFHEALYNVDPLNEGFDVEYWEGIARFYEKYKENIHPQEIRDFIDYFIDQKKANPEYRIKGLTVDGLRRRVLRWHEEMNSDLKSKKLKKKKWEGTNIANSNIIIDGTQYEIIQLKSSNELIKEGEELCHCVSDYIRLCVNGSSSIWSLRKINNDAVERLITIEVKKGKITQAKGRYNRLPNEVEMKLISKWAEEANLKNNL